MFALGTPSSFILSNFFIMLIDFIKPQDGDLSPCGVLIDEGFEDGGKRLLLRARET